MVQHADRVAEVERVVTKRQRTGDADLYVDVRVAGERPPGDFERDLTRIDTGKVAHPRRNESGPATAATPDVDAVRVWGSVCHGKVVK